MNPASTILWILTFFAYKKFFKGCWDLCLEVEKLEASFYCSLMITIICDSISGIISCYQLCFPKRRLCLLCVLLLYLLVLENMHCYCTQTMNHLCSLMSQFSLSLCVCVCVCETDLLTLILTVPQSWEFLFPDWIGLWVELNLNMGCNACSLSLSLFFFSPSLFFWNRCTQCNRNHTHAACSSLLILTVWH